MTRTEILEIAKPIPFNDEMVRAILRNNKSVTRRKVKPQPPKEADGIYERMDNGNFQMKVSPYESIYDYEIVPKYQVGDILYVRETWGEDNHNYLYRADFSDEDLERLNKIMRWRPSIHMPKKAARIFLRVTGVRVERLQDITKDGIIAEGAETDEYLDYEEWATAVAPPGSRMITLRDYFSELWNSTVKKSNLSKYGWDANPWVWVIEFERVEVE